MTQLPQPLLFFLLLLLLSYNGASALSMKTVLKPQLQNNPLSRRDAFFRSASLATGLVFTTFPAISNAATSSTPTILNTAAGVKYAVTKSAKKDAAAPLPGDIVAVEYTGYLTSGQIFDATHSEGKSNALLFKLGTGAVIPGFDDMVSQMQVGQKVQAIIPPSLAYGDKGVCIESGECLIKPGETLVFDIYLKKASIPPP